jgi:hypothetical protein
VSLEELWAYEATHPVVFAAPRALAEARLIAGLSRSRRVRHAGIKGKRTFTTDEVRKQLRLA